jgi:hypothetical protein
MSTDMYAVYDEQTGTIVHLHAAPTEAGQSPDHIIAMLDPGRERSLRLLRLPPEGLTRASRVVDGALQEEPGGGGFGMAGITLTDQAPPQTRGQASRTFQRRSDRTNS